MVQKLTRAFDFEIRAENDEQHGDHVTGMPIVFGQRTDLGFFDEIITGKYHQKNEIYLNVP